MWHTKMTIARELRKLIKPSVETMVNNKLKGDNEMKIEKSLAIDSKVYAVKVKIINVEIGGNVIFRMSFPEEYTDSQINEALETYLENNIEWEEV